jgi:hypothetical protein
VSDPWRKHIHHTSFSLVCITINFCYDPLISIKDILAEVLSIGTIRDDWCLRYPAKLAPCVLSSSCLPPEQGLNR